MAGDLGGAPELFPLRGGRGAFALHTTGFRHPAASALGGETFTAYADLTHLLLGERWLRVGTRQGVLNVPRAAFSDPGGAEALRHALLARLALEPSGPAVLAGMAAIDEAARRPFRPWVTLGAAALCAAVYGLQLALGDRVVQAAYFSDALVHVGELWRLVTANFLHAGLLHLGMNVLGLLVLGALVERPLGHAATFFVLGASALGATSIGVPARYGSLLGASGMVAGLAAAVLWLELRRPARLSAAWRVPRRLFVAAIGVDALLGAVVPEIAGFAHVGGFVAGGVAAMIAGGPSPAVERPRRALRLADALLAAALLLSAVTAGREVWGGADLIAKRAIRLLDVPDVSPLVLNNTAWLLATSPDVDHKRGAVAVRLAERAVQETRRQDPNVLDTLAEAHFAAGEVREAVEIIDEAIALAPDEPYFQEQRRRFTGERQPGDRPAPPREGSPPGQEPGGPLPPGLDTEEPGISV